MRFNVSTVASEFDREPRANRSVRSQALGIVEGGDGSVEHTGHTTYRSPSATPHRAARPLPEPLAHGSCRRRTSLGVDVEVILTPP